MKKSKVLALMLAVVMVVSFTMTAAVSAAGLTPPANSKVRVTDKTLTKTFTSGIGWDVWDTQGSFGTYEQTDDGNLLVSGGKKVPFVMLDAFGGGLAGFDEMVFTYKTDSDLKVSLRIREKGTSAEVTLPATNGEFVDYSIAPSAFLDGDLTAQDLEEFRSYYNPNTGKYDTTAMMNLTSSSAEIKEINAYWYSYSSESNQVRKTLTTDFSETTWGSWGSWTQGPNKFPISMKFVEGEAEDGVGKALYITGGCTGTGAYGGGQFMMNSNFDLTGVDAIRYRYNSTAKCSVYFNRAYQVEVGETLPAAEVDTVKGLLGADYSTYFDASNKCIKYFKKETRSSGVSLPSTGGEWKTVDVPISKFGTQEFLSHMKTAIANKSFAPCYQFRIEGITYGGDTNKYTKFGSVTGVWYEKLPTMSSISFTNNGEDSDYGLSEGTTEVNIELSNAADIEISGSVLVAGLYEGNKLLDVDVEVVTTPALGTSGVKTLSVTMPADVDIADCQLRVMLWDSAESMNQITNLAVLDAFGYFTEDE